MDELQAAIKKGAKLNEKDSFGQQSLHYAVAEKNTDVVDLLLGHGADVTVQDKDGKTALHYAIEHNLYPVAESLLKDNAGLVAIADKHGNQPLWTAAFNAKETTS